jgi:hypothetical protein
MSHQQPGVRAILSLVGAVAAATALLDQVTKLLILRQFSPGEGVTVLPGLFDLTLLFNKGAAFGLFSRIESDVIRLGLLAITTIIALTVLFIVLLREYREDLWGQRAETHRCKTCGHLINTKDCRGCIETRNMQYRLRKARRSGVSTPPENNGWLVTMP